MYNVAFSKSLKKNKFSCSVQYEAAFVDLQKHWDCIRQVDCVLVGTGLLGKQNRFVRVLAKVEVAFKMLKKKKKKRAETFNKNASIENLLCSFVQKLEET